MQTKNPNVSPPQKNTLHKNTPEISVSMMMEKKIRNPKTDWAVGDGAGSLPLNASVGWWWQTGRRADSKSFRHDWLTHKVHSPLSVSLWYTAGSVEAPYRHPWVTDTTRRYKDHTPPALWLTGSVFNETAQNLLTQHPISFSVSLSWPSC